MTDAIKIIRRADIDRCPKHSMLAEHYRSDGSCRCDDHDRLAEGLAKVEAERDRLAADLIGTKHRLQLAEQRVKRIKKQLRKT